MANSFHHSTLLLAFIFFLYICNSEQLQSSQSQTLLKIQKLLNFPALLSQWNNTTDFCNIEPSSSVTVVCYEETITQLHMIGIRGTRLLPRNFSIDSFFTTLFKLPDLKVLTLVSLGLWGRLPGKIAQLSSLEILNMSSNFLYGKIPRGISSLISLQTLVLDDNMITGLFPDWLSELPDLRVLSLKNNLLNGSLPNSLSGVENLRVLAISHNCFYGEVPDLGHLTNLQVLELEDNSFGPRFPRLGKKLVTLILRKNRFRSGVPDEMSLFQQLQRLDISFNTFVGPFPEELLSLPSLTYLNIAQNKLSGVLFHNLSCNGEFEFVDLSSNLLTGSLPNCLLTDDRNRVVRYAKNCFGDEDQNQHSLSFCHSEALAAGISPHEKKRKGASKAVIALSIIGGVVGGIALVALTLLIVRRANAKKIVKKPPRILKAENVSTGYTPKLFLDAGYISQTMNLGTLNFSSYRTFSFEQIVEATNNFDSTGFICEGSHGPMYRGQLKDGSLVAIKCHRMKRSHKTENLNMEQIELISKLRHPNLVSAIGHCFECYRDDDSYLIRMFLVFEYVPNKTLRSWISEGRPRRLLDWTQRVAAAIGIAKGIQFLHTVLGVYSNDTKITNILLDQHLVAKISCYNLPLLAENTDKVVQGTSSCGSKDPGFNASNESEDDIYAFGIVLLEIILGIPINSSDDADVRKEKLKAAISSDDIARSSIVDPTVRTECSDQSLKTIMEICVRCLQNDSADGPSIADVLWNLQFAAQVQDAWGGEFESCECSPVSPSKPTFFNNF